MERLVAAAFPPKPPSSAFAADLIKPPSLAPYSQTYTDLVKVVLKRRLKHLIMLVAGTTFALLLAAVFDPKELPGSLLNFVPAALWSPLALLGALPILVLRKQTLTTELPAAPTLFSRYMLLQRPAALQTFTSYLLASVPLVLAYIYAAYAASESPQLGFFFFHSGREAYQLNERRVYLHLLHLALVAYATVDHVVSSRSRVEFDADQSLTIPARLRAKATTRVPTVIASVLKVNVTFFFVYLLLRRPVLRYFVMNFAGAWARPHLYSLLKHNAAYSITLIVRSIASSFVTLGVWEATHVCFDVYITQRFAFLELSLLTLTDSARRKAIFTDIKRDGAAGGAWHDISRECLKLVGVELQRAKGKGTIPKSPAPAPSPVPSAVPAASPRPLSQSPVKNENVFRPAKKTLFDNLLAAPSPSAAPAKPLPASSSAVAPPSNTAAPRVPSIFQTSSAPSSAAPAATAVVPKPAGSVNLEGRLAGLVPVGFRGQEYAKVFGKRPADVVGACVAKGRPVVWAIEALSNLLCASLQEDPYGVAQRDIPKVLEGFVLYLLALETLTAQLTASVEGAGKKIEREATLKEIAEQVVPIESGEPLFKFLM
ncbi:nucleoporin protein Ndc1-Nup family protein, partial [Pseudohyphozyma bogoriensis]